MKSNIIQALGSLGREFYGNSYNAFADEIAKEIGDNQNLIGASEAVRTIRERIAGMKGIENKARESFDEIAREIGDNQALKAAGEAVRTVRDRIARIEGIDIMVSESFGEKVSINAISELFSMHAINVIRSVVGDEAILDVESAYNGVDLSSLKTVDGVKELFRGCDNAEDWNKKCNLVKLAHDGSYPNEVMTIALTELRQENQLPYFQ